MKALELRVSGFKECNSHSCHCFRQHADDLKHRLNDFISFIKNDLNKPSIYVGGGLQILFGIKGDRWDNHEDVSTFYNSYWVRPLQTEKPIAANSVEGGCYW